MAEDHWSWGAGAPWVLGGEDGVRWMLHIDVLPSVGRWTSGPWVWWCKFTCAKSHTCSSFVVKAIPSFSFEVMFQLFCKLWQINGDVNNFCCTLLGTERDWGLIQSEPDSQSDLKGDALKIQGQGLLLSVFSLANFPLPCTPKYRYSEISAVHWAVGSQQIMNWHWFSENRAVCALS